MLTVRQLRHHWKPVKQRCEAAGTAEDTRIRFHRCCSWLARAEELELADAEQLLVEDDALVFKWIAFNALYGQWDEQFKEPAADVNSWKNFLSTIYKLDEQQRVAQLLIDHRDDVMTILESPFLNRIFWKDPSEQARQKASDKAFHMSKYYVEENWLRLLEQLVHRIYTQRCQCIHGASTYQSHDNRDSIYHCNRMLHRLLEAVLLIWIDDGAQQDWGPLCYPPMP